VVALALSVAIGALVVKPWSWVGGLGPGVGAPTPAAGGQPGGSVASNGPTAKVSPDLVGGGPEAQPTAAQPTASPPPWALIENLDPIDPTTWSHISAGLRLIDRDAVVFVARWPGGLYWRFVPVEPGERLSLAGPPATGNGAGGVPTTDPDTVRMTGFLATPIAIGLARATGAGDPGVVAWQILGPGAEYRLPLRHPVGDLDHFLFLGPGLGLPRGEQRNRREISQFPPLWLPGVYRFDLTSPTGETRHLFVVLDPDALS
jgi:hypothetical protein